METRRAEAGQLHEAGRYTLHVHPPTTRSYLYSQLVNLYYLWHLAMLRTWSSQVIIPVATASKAIVISDGLKGGCLLSDSFSRVMAHQVNFFTRFQHCVPSRCRLR